jgi:hypothetical protein
MSTAPPFREITFAPPQKKVRDRHADGRQLFLLPRESRSCKALMAWNTFGTNDVVASVRQRHWSSGLEWTYQNAISSIIRHSLLIICAIYPPSRSLSGASGITFPFLLRLPGIVADFVVILLLPKSENDPRLACHLALMLFALSPLSILVSGYHGNTDQSWSLLLFSVYFCARTSPRFRPFFALSVQVKIIPLLFFPSFFALDAAPGLLRFVPFAVVSAVLWSEAIQIPRLRENVFRTVATGESGESATCSGSRAGPNSAE